MKYISVTRWRDLTDGHLYIVGEPFPHDGREIPAKRLTELESGRNQAGLRLIKALEDEKKAPEEKPEEKAPEAVKKSRRTAGAKKNAQQAGE